MTGFEGRQLVDERTADWHVAISRLLIVQSCELITRSSLIREDIDADIVRSISAISAAAALLRI